MAAAADNKPGKIQPVYMLPNIRKLFFRAKKEEGVEGKDSENFPPSPFRQHQKVALPHIFAADLASRGGGGGERRGGGGGKKLFAFFMGPIFKTDGR